MAVDRPFPYTWHPGVGNCQPSSPFSGNLPDYPHGSQLFQTLNDHSENTPAAITTATNTMDSSSKTPCPSHNHSRQPALALEGSIPSKKRLSETWITLQLLSLKMVGEHLSPQKFSKKHVIGGTGNCCDWCKYNPSFACHTHVTYPFQAI
jgi:hypothetical protein